MNERTALRNRRWWIRLLDYGKPYWPGMVALLLLTAADSALVAVRPWPTKIIVDHVLIGDSLPSKAQWLTKLPGMGPSPSGSTLLIWLASLTVIVFLAGQLVSTIQSQISAVVGQKITRSVRVDVFDHLQRLSIQFHGRRKVGDLIRRVMSDCASAKNLILGVGLSRFATLVRLGIMLVVIWRMDRSLTLIVLSAGIPLGFISRYFNRGITERSLEEQRLGGEITALAEQTLTVLPVVQGFSREESGDLRFASLSAASRKASLRVIKSQLQFAFGTGAVRSIVTALVMLIGGMHAVDGTLSVGSLLVILTYLGSLLGPLEGLAYASVGFATAAAGARRVFEILDANESMQDAPGAHALPQRPSGEGAHIKIENVVFGYEPDRPVLKGVSIEARPGEMVALVGSTGAGKTTMMGLVPRFFDPWQGRVTIDGIDLKELQLKSLREQVSLVLQDPFILPLSIAENIAYGKPNASRAEIETVARAANAHEFIERLPEGYDSIVGERGATLSGGERQRLAIARAFLKDAPVLILDEPTSALDAGTESLVLSALDQLMSGRTVLVIAHRLSTVRRADKIIVIEQGGIVEQGSHDELIARGGAYKRFYELQYGSPDPVVAPSATTTTVSAVG